MDDKITIIEGPPPVFENVSQGWVFGLQESPSVGDIAMTNLRTFNGPELVERCYRTWRENQTMHLEFRDPDGLERTVPIVAARYTDSDDGQMIVLWVRLADEEIELELGYGDDLGDDFDDDFGLQD
ncbi:MAG: hypothetical protein U9R58_07875 [Chloroflexota bacterium]|nr:hypothetical protein [Chloroflexota bacterium]